MTQGSIVHIPASVHAGEGKRIWVQKGQVHSGQGVFQQREYGVYGPVRI